MLLSAENNFVNGFIVVVFFASINHRIWKIWQHILLVGVVDRGETILLVNKTTTNSATNAWMKSEQKNNRAMPMTKRKSVRVHAKFVKS